jgi:hypothetical protein
MDLQQALAALDGHFEVIPVGLSQLSQEKIQHLAKRGFYVLDPLPPSQQAAQQAFTLALQGNVQGALNLLARDIGQQIAQRYATELPTHTASAQRARRWGFPAMARGPRRQLRQQTEDPPSEKVLEHWPAGRRRVRCCERLFLRHR